MEEHLPPKKVYSLEKIRIEYPNAYRPWTGEEDERFEILRLERKSVSELAEIFGRKKGAIYSRLKKMGLERIKKIN